MSWRAQGLLFLNPPYGDVVSDKAGTGERSKSDRLEKIFFRKAVPWLQYGGVLVLIVPHYVLDREFSSMLAKGFDRIQVYLAPESRFKQAVVFGIRRQSDAVDVRAQARLEAYGRGDESEILPMEWIDEPYAVPAAPSTEIKFVAQRIDGPQLVEELSGMNGGLLWPQFDRHFKSGERGHLRPLRKLSDWHLALALAAGQISGVVESSSGRKLLIKGDTFKERDTSVAHEEVGDGGFVEIRTLTDKFVPCITAIDFTPGPNYGAVVSIR
jgi:hypothetical protein